MIRRSGFPVRYTFGEFVRRFRALDGGHWDGAGEVDGTGATAPANDGGGDGDRAATEHILVAQGTGTQQWRAGRTKVFLRFAAVEALGHALAAMHRHARTLVAVLRGHCVRLHAARLRAAKAVKRAEEEAAAAAAAKRAEEEAAAAAAAAALAAAKAEPMTADTATTDVDPVAIIADNGADNSTGTVPPSITVTLVGVKEGGVSPRTGKISRRSSQRSMHLES